MDWADAILQTTNRCIVKEKQVFTLALEGGRERGLENDCALIKRKTKTEELIP